MVRSTWGAELCQLSDGCDFLLVLAACFAELQHGRQSPQALRDLTAGTGELRSPLQLHACVDAQSVFSGITAEEVRVPAERHALYHAQWVRELLDKKLLEALWWIDTRDCCPDGLTKGSVARDAIIAVMHGEWRLDHAPKRWPARR